MRQFDFTTDELPLEVCAHIRAMKKELRAYIGGVSARFAQVSRFIEREVQAIEALRRRGQTLWPEISYTDIEDGNIGEVTAHQVRRRGCAVIKGHFDKALALGWDKRLVEYLDRNGFDRICRGPGDSFFGSLDASRPEIFPIY